MAMNREVVENMADAIRTVSEELAHLYPRMVWILTQNSNASIDWSQPITCVPDDETSGNLDSRPFSRAEVSNAIYALVCVRALLEEGNGGQLGNINKISRPLR